MNIEVAHEPPGVSRVAALRSTRLRLLSEFQLLIDGDQIMVPRGVQRILAYLGIAARPVSRSRVAGQLWLDVPEWRALGNLRSALWRLRRIGNRMIRSMDDRIALAQEVDVDIVTINDLIGSLARSPCAADLERVPELVAAAELLPGWEDDWIIVERERYRELRVAALEQACQALVSGNDFSGAVQAALAAIESEPFRESPRRLLVRAYLADGNVAEAIRAFEMYRELIQTELGIQPSESMHMLVAGIGD